jgi:hypothetical protein
MTGYRWAGWPPVEVRVQCHRGHLHSVRWEAGELSLVVHGLTEDPAAPCLALKAAWDRYSVDPRVLTVAARDAADALVLGAGPSGIPQSRPPHSPRGRLPEPPWTLIEKPPPGASGGFVFATAVPMGNDVAPAVDGTDPVHDIGVLLRLGHGLGERLVAGVAAACADQVAADPDAELPAVLVTAVHERAFRALRTWYGDPVEVTVTAVDAATLIVSDDDAEPARLGVPVSWLADVWCRDVAVADDAFVLGVEEAHEERLAVRAADSYPGEARRVTVALPVTPDTQVPREQRPGPQPDAPNEAPATRGTSPSSVVLPDWDEEGARPGEPFLVRRLDVHPAYGQLYVTSGFTDFQAGRENASLDALDDAIDSRRFVGVVERAHLDWVLPGWGQPHTPLTVEVWPHTPPDDLVDWDHEVDVDLDVSGSLYLAGSGGDLGDSTLVPAGEFRARLSGRRFAGAHARAGGEELRIRLWRRRRPRDPVTRRTWPGYEQMYPIRPRDAVTDTGPTDQPTG